MFFKDKLNYYINELNCSSKDLSIKSGISQPVISRYRSGERTPNVNSKQLEKLATAIYDIAKDRGINYQKQDIVNELTKVIDEADSFDYTNLSNKLNRLIQIFNININDMSKYIVFDSSHISRIRYGKTKPSDPMDFSIKICNYILSKYNSNDDKKTLTTILECNDSISDKELSITLYNWLINNSNKANIDSNYIDNFLTNLDEFNLNDYIKTIKFDKLKVPSIPFYKIKNRNYYGIEEMKKGELDFFKSTVLSKSKEDIFMCSDMPMEDMAHDVEFGKKWMFAIAMCLKKGLHLNIIHNLDRPFNEMMLGLESWIPIYMTGQVSPYYLKEVKNSIYHHFNYVSGNVALTGECILGNHDKGKYYLTSTKREIEYYKDKAKLILSKANSLMDIYNEKDNSSYKTFLLKDAKVNGNRVRYLNSLPLFTLTDKLLEKILVENNICREEITKIIKYKNDEKNNIYAILQNNKITDNIFKISKEEVNNEDIYLSLDNMFYTKKIKYTYDDYLEHLNSTTKYAEKNSNYSVYIVNDRTFKNITVTILEGNYVIISKSSNPIIHFVIKHPKLVDAIRNFKPIVRESNEKV